MLSRTEIQELVSSSILRDADETRIGQVSYDLRNYRFYRDGETLEEVALEPGGSTFVGAAECVHLPNDLVARVGLKNSRIRQGLTLDAPVYFPGHASRVFFRVTNISANEITLEVGHDIAQVFFERLEVPVAEGYAGVFANEFDFNGVGSYKDVYGSETKKLRQETEKLENVEQRVYANVAGIMGVFIALFTLVSVDMSWLSGTQQGIRQLVVLNLSIVGGMSAMIGLISSVLGSRGPRALPWIVSAAAFALSFLLVLL